MEILRKIQQELEAPKGQYNSFGKYHYRSCEDILGAVKPLLGEAVLTLSDEIVEVGGRVYVKATARLVEGSGSHKYVCAISKYLKGESIDKVMPECTCDMSGARASWETTAYAREALDKKGMDDAQITGAASSYARKYALNGLFCIDDTKDADTQDNSAPETTTGTVHIPKITIPTKPVAKPAAPKGIAETRKAYHARILELCDELALAPLLTDEDVAVYVKENTGLDFEPEHYLEIGKKLAALKAKN